MKFTETKKLSGALAIAGVLLLVGIASAQRGGPPGPRGGHGGSGFGPPPGGLGPLARDLDLTDAQKAEIKKITDASRESTKALHEQLRALHGEVAAPEDGAFDEAAVRAAAQERAKVMVELEVERARVMSQIYAVLTVEQRAKLAERRQRFEQRLREFKPPAEEAPISGM